MKKLAFLPTLLFICSFCNAQKCTDDLILSHKNSWNFEKDTALIANFPVASFSRPEVHNNLEEYRKLLVTAYPQAIGGLIRGFKGITGYQEKYVYPTTVPYNYTASFQGFWCNKEKNELVTNPDFLSSSLAQILTNSLFNILETYPDEYKMNGKKVQLFKLARQKTEIRDFKVFEAFGFANASAILFTHKNKLPYRILTQIEYLEIMKEHWTSGMQSTTNKVSGAEKEILEMIENAKKEYTGEMREMMLKELNTQLAEIKKQQPITLKGIKEDNNSEVDSINRYLSTAPPSELNKPAIPVSFGVHRGFTTEKDGGYHIAIIDESYFNSKLPAHIAQFIVFYWYHTPPAIGAKFFRESIEKNFSFDKLNALLGK